MRLSLNKAFSDWYDGLPYGEPTYQETFEAGQRAATISLDAVTTLQFLSDVVTAAGLLHHGKTDKALSKRIADGAYRLRTAIVESNVRAKAPAEGASP